MRKTMTSMLAGIGLSLACGTSAYAQDKELTIFWAEWDPANYLQELVNEYEKETGVKVTVETTPWSDFQTKAFTEFNAKGSAYDMVVGDSQWLGAGLRRRPLCRPDRLLQQAQSRRSDGAGDGEILRRISAATAASTGRSRPKATRSAGPIARTGSRTPRKWKPSRPSTATISACRRTSRRCATSPNSSTVRTRSATASPSTPTTPMTRWRWASRTRIFSYRRRTRRLCRPTRSTASSTPTRRRGARRLQGALQLHASGLGQDLLRRGQPGDHRKPGGDEHELLRLLPGADQRSVEPECQEHRLLRQPSRPGRRPVRRARRAGHLDHLLFARTRKSR